MRGTNTSEAGPCIHSLCGRCAILPYVLTGARKAASTLMWLVVHTARIATWGDLLTAGHPTSGGHRVALTTAQWRSAVMQILDDADDNAEEINAWARRELNRLDTDDPG